MLLQSLSRLFDDNRKIYNTTTLTDEKTKFIEIDFISLSVIPLNWTEFSRYRGITNSNKLSPPDADESKKENETYVI